MYEEEEKEREISLLSDTQNPISIKKKIAHRSQKIDKIMKKAFKSVKCQKYKFNKTGHEFERNIKSSKPTEEKFPSCLNWIPDLKKKFSLQFFCLSFFSGILAGF